MSELFMPEAARARIAAIVSGARGVPGMGLLVVQRDRSMFTTVPAANRTDPARYSQLAGLFIGASPGAGSARRGT
jgi:hypothetical protein